MNDANDQGCAHDQLEASVYGELDARGLHAIEEHVLGCPRCAAELAMLRRERALFAGRAERPIATETLWAGIEAQLAPARAAAPVATARAPQRSRLAAWTGGLVACAAAVLLCVRFVAPAGDRASLSVQPIAPSAVPGAALPEAKQAKQLDRRWSFAVGDQPRLSLETVSGEVEITAGGKDRIEVRAQSDAPLGTGWKLEVREEQGAVRVRLWCEHGCDHDAAVRFRIMLPAATSIELRTVSADVHVRGLEGGIEVKTTSGEVAIDGPSGWELKTEPIVVETVSGDVEWAGQCQRGCVLRIETVSGDVVLSPRLPSQFLLRFHSVSGKQRGGASYPGGGPSEISVRTVSGDLTVEDM